MNPLTFDRLGDLPDAHLEALRGWLTEGLLHAFAPRPRVAQVIDALLDVVQGEQQRRAGQLAHTAPVRTVALPTLGELSDTERRELMRWLQEQRTRASGGMPEVAGFCDTVLDALELARAHQRATLERLDRDLC